MRIASTRPWAALLTVPNGSECDALSVDGMSTFPPKTMPTSSMKRSRLITALGQAIRKHRKAHTISQERLAEIADFDRTYISLVERGERNPSFTNLCRIAAALGITPSELLEGIAYDGGEDEG